MTEAVSRKCIICHAEKPLTEFYVSHGKYKNISSYCKPCAKKDAIRRKHADPEYKKRQHELVNKINKTEKWVTYHREYSRKKRQIDKERKFGNIRNRAFKHVDIDRACYFCNSSSYLVRHHHDYNKPLDVTIICKSCHQKLHYMLDIHIFTNLEKKV